MTLACSGVQPAGEQQPQPGDHQHQRAGPQAVTAMLSTPVTCAAVRTAHILVMTDTMIDDRWAQHGIDADSTRNGWLHGFDADAAGVWIHHRVAPVDARAWERAGFHGGDLPSRAALWHHNAFTPKDALAWGALPGKCSGPGVFAPSIAVLFRDAGFTPRQAWPWWRRGFTASLAEKWRDAAVSVTVAEGWINGGIDNLDLAAAWIEAGATPAEAALYLRSCPDTDEALEWRERGFDAASIPGWVEAGFTADDAPDWAARWIQPADAAEWRSAGFSAVEAFMWRAQRIEPTAARGFVARGLRDPLTAVRSVG